MLNQTQIGFISSRCFDQFHHRQRWVDRRLFEMTVDDRAFCGRNALSFGKGTEKIVTRSSEVSQIVRSGQHERLVGTFLLDGSIMDLERNGGIDLNGVTLGAQNLVAIGGDELSRVVE